MKSKCIAFVILAVVLGLLTPVDAVADFNVPDGFQMTWSLAVFPTRRQSPGCLNLRGAIY